MNLFEQYGLKEVANVTFYDIATNKPVLFLDSLKVSTIEQTAENVEARGGWGNPALVSWDYNKDVNMTLEDALFSPTSLKVMMGAGIYEAGTKDIMYPDKTIAIDVNQEIVIGADGKGMVDHPFVDPKDGRKPYFFNPETGVFEEAGITIAAVQNEGHKYDVTLTDEKLQGKMIRVFYPTIVDGAANGVGMVINIDAAHFGGTYRIVGDTIVRSRKTGQDEAFQFVIGKAKINSEITFTMEAEGDPATFNMPIKVLKDERGDMFRMIKYGLPPVASK